MNTVTVNQKEAKDPSGYHRSDERIAEEIRLAMKVDKQLDASAIEVIVRSGDVTLTGSVSQNGDKQRAEDCIRDIYGIKNIENRLMLEENKSSTKHT